MVKAVSGEQLVIRAYDPSWPFEFERLRDRALAVLGDITVAVEHVGSTAVPGLAAKPVIDLDVVVASGDHVETALGRLAALGYERAGRGGVVATVEGLAAPRWPHGERRHHLYVVVAGSRVHRERLAFRDYLRKHAEQAQHYAELKVRMARDGGGDWERYTQLKHEFVQRTLRAALADRCAGRAM